MSQVRDTYKQRHISVFLTTKYILCIIHIFGSEKKADIHLFFSNLSEMKTVHICVTSCSLTLIANYESWLIFHMDK